MSLTDVAAEPSTPPSDTYYTVERIERILARWQELPALAETPSSAMGLLQPGQTRESPRVGAKQPGHHADTHRWSDIRADVERAWMSLPYRSLAWEIIWARMLGTRLVEFADRRRVDYVVVQQFHERALDQMSVFLGGPQPTPRANTGTPRCSTCGTVLMRLSDEYCSVRCRIRSWKTEGEYSGG